MNAVSKLSSSPSVTTPDNNNNNNNNNKNKKTKQDESHHQFHHTLLVHVEQDDERNEADFYNHAGSSNSTTTTTSSSSSTFTVGGKEGYCMDYLDETRIMSTSSLQEEEMPTLLEEEEEELSHNDNNNNNNNNKQKSINTNDNAKLNTNVTCAGYFQTRPSNYHQLIGPIRFVESKERVGDYDIGPRIGDGKFAKVYSGTNRLTRKEYAIKVLAKTRLNDGRILANLEAELHILKVGCHHPNLVSFQVMMHAPHNVYVVMSKAHIDLFDYVCHLDPTEDVVSNGTMVRECMIGILGGLDYLHINGIAHMDLKPENVLITEDVSPNCLTRHHIQLCDFGFGEVAATPLDRCPIRHFVGTLGFYAPELTTLTNDLDGRHADMWSIGCLMVELTQGLPPTWMETYAKRNKEDTLAFKTKLTRGVWDICGVVHPHDHDDDDGSIGGDHDNMLSLLLPNNTPEHLVSKLLVLEPTARWSAKECLLHPWLIHPAANDSIGMVVT